MRKEKYLELIENELQQQPWYAQEYYQSKSTIPLSNATLYQYLTEFRRFFDWLLAEGIVDGTSIKTIDISVLEHLKKEDMELYKSSLLSRSKSNNANSNTQLSRSTVNRSLTAISSLFRYLSEETEKEDGEPYFYRNVMKKISVVKDNETFATRAANIKDKLMLGTEDRDYINFIDQKYANLLKPKGLSFFKRDKDRDIAINALMLGSGLRVSEVANSDLPDLNLKTNNITVIRKGGKKDTVPIAPWVIPYLVKYLEVRAINYKTDKSEKALFCSSYRGIGKRIESGTIEKLVAKYSSAFKVRVTPHKLRHTLASKLYLETKNEQLVATQLGQSSTSATALYTHMIDEEQRNAINKL
ncbi:tyrosine recombinase XerS [Dellaglioa sp. L3N]